MVFDGGGAFSVSGFGAVYPAESHGYAVHGLLFAVLQLTDAYIRHIADVRIHLGLLDRYQEGLVRKFGNIVMGLALRQRYFMFLHFLTDNIFHRRSDETVQFQKMGAVRHLAFQLVGQTLLLQCFHLGDDCLDVTRAQGLMQLSTGTDDGVEGMETEDAILLLEGCLERLHGRVVQFLACGENEIAVLDSLCVVDVVDNDVTRVEPCGVSFQQKIIESNRHSCFLWSEKHIGQMGGIREWGAFF